MLKRKGGTQVESQLENIINIIATSRLIIEGIIKRPVWFSGGAILISAKTTTIIKNAMIMFFISIKSIKTLSFKSLSIEYLY